MKDCICARCGALLNKQEGFNPNAFIHECRACGAKQYDPDIYQGERFKGVYWHCNRCNALLNTQSGFRDIYDSWKCTGCSYENRISENELGDSSKKFEENNNSNKGNQQAKETKDQYTIYCNRCGNPLKPGDNFCLICGKQQKSTEPENHPYNSERKNVYVGEVRKCPSCGADLSSFSAVCPHCGHELNSIEVPESIKEFSKELSYYDNEIANSPIVRPWKEWSGGKKFWWIVLNIFTFCVPLFIYLFFLIGGYGGFGKLSPVEIKKETYINNYSFPNERESVLEALFFIKSQVVTLSNESKNAKNKKWIKIWKNKAKQLLNKSDLLFKEDTIASNTYNDIEEEEKKVQRIVFLKSVPFIILAIICVVMIFVTRASCSTDTCNSCNSCNNIFQHSYDKSENNKQNATLPTISENVTTNESEGIFCYPIRNYAGKNAASIGKIEDDYLIDEYGSGELRIVFVTENGLLISENNEEKKKYVVVGQNIPAGSTLAEICDRGSDGKIFSSIISYQSYDEIILYVAPIGDSSYKPNPTLILPTLDMHKYHIKDYTGRNAAAFGKNNDKERIDEYGACNVKIEFKTEDGSFVDNNDLNNLKQYIVTDQDVPANEELNLTYETDSQGHEFDVLIKSQSIEVITLTVKKIK